MKTITGRLWLEALAAGVQTFRRRQSSPRLPTACAVQQEVVLVAPCRVVSVFGDIQTARTSRAIGEATAYARPWLRFHRRHEPVGAACGRAVWDAPEHRHTTARIAAHLTGSGF